MYEELGHLAQRVALLSRVDNEPAAALLRREHALHHAVHEARATATRGRREDIAVVGLVVKPHAHRLARVREGGDVAEHVDCYPVDWRQEELEVRPRHELGEHAAGLLVQQSAQLGLVTLEAPRHVTQVPHGLDCRFGHHERAIGGNDLAVGLELAQLDRLLDLEHVEVRLGHRDGRTHVEIARLDPVLEDVLHDVAPRVERADLARHEPRLMRPDLLRRERVGEVGPKVRRRGLRGERNRAIHRVGSAVRADRVPLARLAHRRHHRAALGWVPGIPAERLRVHAELVWVGG
mmetsp:Transcript_37829/g.88992  ORF Transcript_37829/g.88992 Transcript_37829/m.88992 type:complete len:292 (-) Transcript_37829:88-963(-)